MATPPTSFKILRYASISDVVVTISTGNEVKSYWRQGNKTTSSESLLLFLDTWISKDLTVVFCFFRIT